MAEQLPHRREVPLRTRPGPLEKRLDLGSEMQLAPALADEERLFAEAVARHEEVVAARVPDRKREHPAQALDAALAPMLVRAQQHLGVGIEREAAAERLGLASQLAKVVDLAVERQDQARALGAHLA